eukprot:CAMPEP_0116830100 /NCGR_PEP_ID=MMETSP0418-20121206/4578_1 /TAXON_ID=1158023 /ORGANISM="Astrosyne radiata, Strain 13vi08-1A" /LENGTH=375 /DNA_ID=CAMNT_0004459171 /DNA_START=48 /DNA_END=1175 /DNA_ORIENTATION=-
MIQVVEDTCKLVSSADPQKTKPIHQVSGCASHKEHTTPCENGHGSEGSSIPNDATSKVAKVSQKVQQQIKDVYENHAIFPEDIDFENAWRMGGGAFCDVYEVSMNNQTLAMKTLSKQTMAHASPKQIAQAAADLARESALLSDAEHENIVKMHGISPGSLLEEGGEIVLDDEKKSFFILMDRLRMTLDEKIMKWKREEGRSMPPSWRVRRRHQQRQDHLWERLEDALALARGLQYLHEKNIIHCDIKPDNVGFDRNGVLKIFDFGLAMKAKTHDAKIRGAAGTPDYMAPEIHAKQPYGKKVDVFAFAMTLWQMCALEHRPAYEVGCDGRPNMEKWWPAELREVMAKCWCAEPDNRPSFDEVTKSIEKILLEGRER